MKQVILTMNVDGEPFSQKVSLWAALASVVRLSARQQVSNVTIVGRVGL